VSDADGRAQVPEERLGAPGAAPDVAPADEPPAEHARRQTEWVSDHDPSTRDMRPALGTRGAPGPWRRAAEGAPVALSRPGWGDATWSFLYKHDTIYAGAEPEPGEVAAAARRGRAHDAMPPSVQGPVIKPPVWTWEVPLYFWAGGVAAGSAFVGLACDVAGDGRSAAVARRVALGAVAPAPLLLIADLGRPARCLNMLRIFKPRSPMNLGAWCLVAFSTVAAGAVGADVLGRPRLARGLGAGNALLAGYLGSYTGVLLAATAVPLWARSRLALGPIFVATATATGAAACRLVLVASGLPARHPTGLALARLESGAMLAELGLSVLNERRLGRAADAMHQEPAGRLFGAAKWLVRAGLALRLVRGRASARAQDAASACFLAGGMAFRFAWVEAGKLSAADDDAVARAARGRLTREDEWLRPRPVRREASAQRTPLAGGRIAATLRTWTETVRRTSLVVERVLGRILIDGNSSSGSTVGVRSGRR
jgi:formate-dependent nitrite reductase membrane component NrfD